MCSDYIKCESRQVVILLLIQIIFDIAAREVFQHFMTAVPVKSHNSIKLLAK